MATPSSALRRFAPFAPATLLQCSRPAAPARPPPLLREHRRTLFNLASAVLGTSSSSSGSSSSPSGPKQSSIATVRTLPYAAADLFRIVADINAYAQFLPHCTVSRVTHWRSSTSPTSSTAATTTTPTEWPARADLTVGWGPLSQTYSSRVYCVPGHGVVEAVSGRAGAPTLTAAERAEIGLHASEDADGRRLGAATASDDETFESLVTRWKVQSLVEKEEEKEKPKTRVELHIVYQFRNPLFQMAAAQVGNEMATKMIEAFEARAAHLLGPLRRQRL